MRGLIDAHTLIWAVDRPAMLGAAATSFLKDPANDLLLSAGTIWEIAIKVGLKKLNVSLPYRQWLATAMIDLKLALLPITVEHADAVVGLPLLHRDPFDRLLVAQATVEDLPLISADEAFDQYSVKRIWD